MKNFVEKDLPTAKGPHCPNCYSHKPDDDKFCTECGQKHTKLNESVWHVVSDTFVQLFSFDGRIFRTLYYLMFRPGYLSCEFRIGRRKRYIGPIQLFLFSSVCYFFAIGMTISVDELDPRSNEEFAKAITEESKKVEQKTPAAEKKEEAKKSADDQKIRISLIHQSMLISMKEIRTVKHMNRAELEAFMKSRDVDPDPVTVRLLLAGSVLFDKNGAEKLMEKVVEIGAQFSVIFVPVLAILIRMFYPFKENRLLHTAVFSAHLHASILLIGAVMAIIGIPIIFMISIQTLVFMLFLYMGLSRFYQQWWFFSLFKIPMLFFCYFVLTTIVFTFWILAAIISL